MSSPEDHPRANGDVQSLRVEPGETIVLSPESGRFQDHYRRIQPRTAKEVRTLVGLADDTARTLRDRGAWREHAALDRLLAPRELESHDKRLRARAFDTTGMALRDYMRTTTPELMAQMEPAIERYLELTQPVVNVVALHDIDIADGATLTISDDTHLVEANKLTIHGTGRMNCGGFTKLDVTSIEGL